MKKPVVIGLAVVVLAAVVAGGYWWYQSRQDNGLTLYGNVDIRTVNLSFRVGGRVESLAVDEGDAIKAGQVLGELDHKPYEIALMQAKAGVSVAQAQYDLMLAGYRDEEIAQAAAAVKQAQAQLAQAELNLQDSTLIAPSDGTLLTRAVEPGTVLNEGGTVFTVSLTRPVWVRAYVDERNLDQAQPGRKVLLYTDGRPDKPYHGQIGFVSPTAEFTPKTVETPDLRTDLVYRLRIVVTDADDALRQGMPVTVQFGDEAGHE
ncbi:TPA: HlyD family efflux transporter periplasmic adaptor subunit [Escherichia coli]|nr:HlyD family efflux transporter periplasmic adaptor subunit [Escherichia coli]